MKKCTKCEKEKPESEFYAKRNDCKECWKAHMRAYKKSDKGKETEREYEKREARKKKRHARNLVNKAIREGKIKKQPCLVCGEEKVDAHHWIYEYPYFITFLCRPHHDETHERMKRNANSKCA